MHITKHEVEIIANSVETRVSPAYKLRLAQRNPDRSLESMAETQPTGFFEIVGDYFPVLHLELCSRHCLLFKTSPNDSEQHYGNDSSPSQEGPVKIKLLSRHQLCRAGRVFPL